MENNTKASTISDFLQCPLVGTDIDISCVSSITTPRSGSLLFLGSNLESLPLSQAKFRGCLILADHSLQNHDGLSWIQVTNPRAAFAMVVSKYFMKVEPLKVTESAQLADDFELSGTVGIGEYCIVGSGTKIGRDSVLRNLVVVASNTEIGRNCLIKSGAVIGEEGFGFDRDAAGKNLRIPHLGNVILCDHVEIGANSTIAKGTIGGTKIGAHTKIDDSVYIAHNCQIGANNLVASGARICGSVATGDNVWIGPGAIIRDGIRVGSGAHVTMGAVVTQDVAENETVSGNFAVPHSRLIAWIKSIL
jgi:UDP-3-O-[3-hydroxymyristoyl] glucosamine N-acyltransferase LpxD